MEGHLMPDHIHMCMSVPIESNIAFVIGLLKGKSAVSIVKYWERNGYSGYTFRPEDIVSVLLDWMRKLYGSTFVIKRRTKKSNWI